MDSKKEKIDFAIGGQAVIEGVMMRSPHFYVVSVRDETGKIHCKKEKSVSLTKRFWFFKIPIIRGVVHLIESMIIGFRALSYSNNVFLGKSDEKVERGKLMTVLFAVLAGIYIIFTLAITLFLLKFLPLFVAQKVASVWSLAHDNYLVFNAIDGLTKISIFIGYILIISLLPDIRRVFEYHGAEHKSIFTYEAGLALVPKNARKQSRFHPRCGTSFIFLVVLMSVFVYTLIPQFPTFLMNLLERIAVIPLIAGLSYELLKFSARKKTNFFVKVLIAPGLFIQRLTTREPTDAQLEVALNSLREALAVEGENISPA